MQALDGVRVNAKPMQVYARAESLHSPVALASELDHHQEPNCAN
jgi:hypothetical protein